MSAASPHLLICSCEKTMPLDVPAINRGCAGKITGGMRSVELAAALPQVGTHPALTAIEIAEYNPGRDRDCRSARLVTQLLDAMLYGLQPARGTATPNELELPGVEIDRKRVHGR